MAGRGRGHAAFSLTAKSPAPTDKDLSIQQKRQELESEVEELQRTMDREEKVHRVLERALNHQGNESKLEIPSFLPKKMKDLLGELILVEGEIARLESEITKIRHSSADPGELKPSPQGHASEGVIISPTAHESLLASVQEIPEKRGKREKIALENRPMFFINQAIKGDFNTLQGFDSKRVDGSLGGENETTGKKEGPTTATPQQQERTSKKKKKKKKGGGITEKQSSPRLPLNLKNSTPSKPLESERDSAERRSGGKAWQANRLSERIMKCLNCIFLRLMRTTRAVELDKLSVISKSTRAPLGSRSFIRAEGNVDSKAPPDPYGVFKMEESVVRDIGSYKNLVMCTAGSMDVRGISTCSSLTRKLRTLMDSLRDLDLRFLTHQQRLAFWINMYNACIMHGFLDQGLPSSPDKILALRSKVVLNIGGNKLNALAIEHFILRLPPDMKDIYWKCEKGDNQNEVQSIYGLDHPEPNVTFALCCGTKSSPALRIYTAGGVISELEKAKLDYLQAAIVVTESDKIMIPQLLVWTAKDFAEDLVSLVQWICDQLPASGSLRKSIAACLRGRSIGDTSNKLATMPYELDFQYLFPV